jgi:AcrR family transcriptional regulator
MSLFDEHKAERRARILAAARELIATRGYDGLTMRDLATASRVSVPTLYNLFGGKHALLVGELEETFAKVAASPARAAGRSFVDRAFAMLEAGNDDLLATPRYTRELVHLFLTSDETEATRRQIRDRYVALMADVLRDGQAAREFASWADPDVVARRMFSHYTHTLIEWGKGELDDDAFRTATMLGGTLMLLGLARGKAARTLERRARALQDTTTTAETLRARRRGGRS